MALTPDRQTLKLQALQSLDLARASLSGGWAQAREDWRPRNVIRESVGKHQTAVIITTVIAGFLATRWIIGAFQKGPATPVGPRKRTWMGFLANGIWGMAREPLIALASARLMPIILQYVSQFQAPPQSNTTPE